MDFDERKKRVDLTYKKIFIISISFIAIVFIYYGIGYFVINIISGKPIDLKILNIFKNGLLTLSIGDLVIAGYIKKIILKKESKDIEIVCQNYISANIVSMAFCESVALYGLLMVFLSKDISHYFLFMSISLIGFFIYFPRKNELEEIIIKL